MAEAGRAGKILILAEDSCAYPGADAVGQGHQSYPANTYILRVPAAVLFPEQFYLDCFAKGQLMSAFLWQELANTWNC